MTLQRRRPDLLFTWVRQWRGKAKIQFCQQECALRKFSLGSLWRKRKVQRCFKFHKSEESSLGGNPPFPSLEMTLLGSEYRSTLPNGTMPFHAGFCSLSASWSRAVAVSWGRQVKWGGSIWIAPQILERFVTGAGRTPVNLWNPL